VGGAYTDRIGGRRILLGSCIATIAAGLWFMFAQGFWMLLAGQLVFILARAAFWPATWAMASELPGARGTQLGRLNAVTSFGQIVGTMLCGFLLAAGLRPHLCRLALTGAVGSRRAATKQPRKPPRAACPGLSAAAAGRIIGYASCAPTFGPVFARCRLPARCAVRLARTSDPARAARGRSILASLLAARFVRARRRSGRSAAGSRWRRR
jgi:MFS family permease